MSNPIVHAFFLGRAVAEVLQEQAERTVTDILSEIGKFDAEQRVFLRQFTDQVQERARSAEDRAGQSRSELYTDGLHPHPASGNPPHSAPIDLQATLDDLRAEIARLRAELKHQRDRSES